MPHRRRSAAHVAQLAIENRMLRLLLESAVAHLMDLTDCVENGDPPDTPDGHISIPMGYLQDARGAAEYIAQKAGLPLD